jgi:hypothetical protein
MAFSPQHLSAFERWKSYGGLQTSSGEATKVLTDGELAALCEDPNFTPEVEKERLRRAKAAALPLPPPPAPTPAQRFAVLADSEIRDGENIEQYERRNLGKAASVAYLSGRLAGLWEAATQIFRAIRTKSLDRNRRLDTVERQIGILPALPDYVERGRWEAGVLYYANDLVTSEGQTWRCLGEHRAETKNAPDSDGALNVSEPVEAPKPLPGEGSAILHRLAAVERALGITAPERER